MTSSIDRGPSSAIRHRIKEITLHPDKSKRPIGLEISVDNKVTHKLTTIEPGHPLCWSVQTYPCDTYTGAKIELKFTEKHHTSSDRHTFVNYTASDDPNRLPITERIGAFPSLLSTIGISSKKSTRVGLNDSLEVSVTFWNMDEAAMDHPNTLVKVSELMKVEDGPLDKMGNARAVLKALLGFGAVVAELHPTAKLVVGLLTNTWEHLEKIQGQHDDLQQLINGLESILPFIESVKSRARENILKHTVLALVYLIEDTSNFVTSYLSRSNTGRTLQGLLSDKVSDQIGVLLQRFNDLKESFDRGVGVQVLDHVFSSAQRALLGRLNPSARSHYASTSPCQDDTRSQILDEVYAWSQDLKSSSKLLWIHGQAGMGKSSIASSVCRRLSGQGGLGASFFCKRDDPKLRTADHILNTLVYNLSCRYEPYGQAVASAIEKDIQLPDSPLEHRYVHLIARPLQDIASKTPFLSQPFLVVVDALDECELGGSRRSLLSYLREMSQLVSWIRILVTSRPDQDIKKALGDVNKGFIDSRNLLDYDASGDIFKFTQKRMAGIADENDLPKWPEDSIRLLSVRSSGLFIWAETACRFIERGSDINTRLEQILEEMTPTESLESLDLLYTTAITQSMGDGGEDNVRNVRQCLGAIVATAGRTPQSVSSLESLLSSRIKPGVIRTAVKRLGAVLYEDQSRGGVVRVYHPSFADFILHPSRSDRFHTDPEEQNATLADCCLRIMIGNLKFNICGLGSSYMLNRDVVNLDAQVQGAIPQYLVYSCLHWSSHLTSTSDDTSQSQLGEFLHGPQLIYWIEAMSLLGQLSVALSSLLRLIDWIPDTMERHSSYANDAYRFILTFFDAISESTPHLYISALAFAPIRSQFAQQMRQFFPNTFKVIAGPNESWPAWLLSMPHDDYVRKISSSRDGGRIASLTSDGTVRIWDAETGVAVSESLGGKGVSRFAISSDGRHVCSASKEGILQLWDTEAGAAVLELPEDCTGKCISITFSSDDQRIFSSHDDGTIKIYTTESGAESYELYLEHSDSAKHRSRLISTALSPDGRLIASRSTGETIKVWNAETAALVTDYLTAFSHWTYYITFSPNSRIIASCHLSTVWLWDVTSGTCMHQLTGHSYPLTSVAFSPNGRHLVSGSNDRTIRVWDVEAGLPVCEPLVGHMEVVNSVAFCSNGRRIVSASADKTARIWEVETDAAPSAKLLGHSDQVDSVVFSEDGRYIISGSKDGTVRMWDVHTGAEEYKPLIGDSGDVRCVDFDPNSQRIVSLAGEKTVQVWDVETGVLVTKFSLDHSGGVLSIALSPDGRCIASGSRDRTVGLWEIDTGAAVFQPRAGHLDEVRSVVFSSDDRIIASGCDDCTVRIWEAKTGAAVGQPFTGHEGGIMSVCFSPDNRRIVSGSRDDTLRVWDTETGTTLLGPLQGHSHRVLSVVFSPDNRYIVSGSYNGTVGIWDAETGAIVSNLLVGHSQSLTSVAVSPDGSSIASSSWDSTVRIWSVRTATADPEASITAFRLNPSALPLSTGFLAHYANSSGWVTSDDGTLLLWLPKDRRHADDSTIQISADPSHPRSLLLDFSKFVHGESWASVARGE